MLTTDVQEALTTLADQLDTRRAGGSVTHAERDEAVRVLLDLLTNTNPTSSETE